ncbi:MAG: gamma-glutamyltransferase, partial [Halioglobus sp.]|nr:gamma-glutamyltransferase [Halioglobus sp.]
GEKIFGRSTDGFDALHDQDRVLRDPGSPVIVPHLADTLQNIADNGGNSFYRGDIAAAIVKHVAAGGGRLSARDMGEYRAIPRAPLMSELAGWQIASNPPPAIGGAVLSALLGAVRREPHGHWTGQSLLEMIRVQQTVLAYRRDRLDLCDDIESACAELLSDPDPAVTPGPWVSSSTVHTSAVDSLGNACAITASSGYGSGEMPAGTGLWLNNCLGELELNRRGLEAGPPGRRLPSNMTPGAARKGDRVLAFGSPGADRITTALQQFLVNFMHRGMSLGDAIAAPRLHVTITEKGATLAAEPGIPVSDSTMPVTLYPALNMYFGGVGAALYSATDGFAANADPRRAGGTTIAGK